MSNVQIDVPEEEDLEEFEEIGTTKQSIDPKLLNWAPVDQAKWSDDDADEFTTRLRAELEKYKAATLENATSKQE